MKRKEKKSNGDHKFYSTVRLYVNAGFQLGIEWEVTGGEAANGEQRSSCIRGLARAQGSMWRTEPSDLLPATSPHPLLLSQENSTALVLSMDCYITVSTILQPEMEPFQLSKSHKKRRNGRKPGCVIQFLNFNIPTKHLDMGVLVAI